VPLMRESSNLSQRTSAICLCPGDGMLEITVLETVAQKSVRIGISQGTDIVLNNTISFCTFSFQKMKKKLRNSLKV